jgi:hypothetical protein
MTSTLLINCKKINENEIKCILIIETKIQKGWLGKIKEKLMIKKLNNYTFIKIDWFQVHVISFIIISILLKLCLKSLACRNSSILWLTCEKKKKNKD